MKYREAERSEDKKGILWNEINLSSTRGLYKFFFIYYPLIGKVLVIKYFPLLEEKTDSTLSW
nr:MAG TPA: hypothetical protein [Caudoviricetes sp.]